MIAASKTGSVASDASGNVECRSGSKPLRWIVGLGALLAIFLFLRVFTGTARKSPPPAARPVATANVITKDVPLYLDEIGSCAASESVQVQAQVSGQIVDRHFEDGADIKKGDLLFSIDPRPFQAALDGAKADDVLAQANLKRQMELQKQGVTATQDLDTAKANAMRTTAAVESAQVNLDYCSIRSPIDGRAGLRQVDVGNTVTAGSSGAVLVQIDKLDPIYTDFTIAEPDIPFVRQYLNNPNLKVETDAENDKYPARSGKLYFIANTVQTGTGTVQARGETANPDHALWPSQFVRVRLILDLLKDALLVPNEAVQIGQKGPYVFVVKADNSLDLRQVKSGQRQGDFVVVQDGVKVGETIVVRGQLQLAPGMKVAPQAEGAAALKADAKAPSKDAVP